jgi:peroxiredoxin
MKRNEIAPAVIALAIGIPLIVLFLQAVAAGEKLRLQGPLRAVLGDHAFELLSRGQKSEEHYLGNTRQAPDFTLQDRYGREFRMSDQRGRLVILNFWTKTCQPCVEELPTLERLTRMVESRNDVAVVTVSTDAGWNEVKALIPPEYKLKVVFDSDRAVVTRKYGTRLFPETYFIDAKGVIRLRYDGARDWSDPLTLQLIELFQ